MKIGMYEESMRIPEGKAWRSGMGELYEGA
jgi:hypothetical protein